ncbi:GLIPR1-like protein 1 [Pygocentrus nattereri]|uniref:SCP domain-containing protein n=1 Tax=Pygocentrus nattereri TaxID=42514 RepID=A0A3B4CEC6_PYGNA|nr:GLIPR1-like protein 1 [Pygocentrus nattereri]
MEHTLTNTCCTMGIWNRAVICLILLLTTPAVIRPVITDQTIPDITDQNFINDCVGEHNQGRSNVNPPASNMRYMSWDEGLAVTARAWARNCLFVHNIYLRDSSKVHPVFKSVGENLWAGTWFRVKDAIHAWVNELQHYTYETMSCSKVCGHYTQVVWGNSYKVGCAVQFCPKGIKETTFSHKPGYIFVCNYATAGNYRGQKPYITGSPCSNCSGEKCENKLCRNSTRDALKRYNWTPSWDPALSECGSFCKAVLITRPVSLLIIFISVYCIQHYYPNLFAYTS